MDHKKPGIARVHLHSLLVSLITYEPEEVQKILQRVFPGRRIFRKRVDFIRPELDIGHRYADAVWLMLDGKHSLFILAFEVKTGRFSYEWIKQLKSIRRALDKLMYRDLVKKGVIREREGRERSCHRYIILICPRSEIPKVERCLGELELQSKGRIILVPIDVFKYALSTRVEAVKKIIESL